MKNRMKNIFLILLCGCLAISCQKELDFGSGDITPPNDFPVNDTCFACDYSPICDSSQFNYIDTVNGVAQAKSFLYDVKSDTVVNAVTFKKILELNSNIMNYFSCSNNVLKIYAPSATSTGGTQLSNIIQTPLKSNEPAGTRWKDVIQVTGGSIEYRYTIIEKGITYPVLDSNYTNVIFVRDTAVSIVPLMGEIPFAVRESYYAKGIGMVKVILKDLIIGQTQMVSQLKSYHFR